MTGAACELTPWMRHRSNQIAYMPFLLVEKGGVARLHAQCRQKGVLVRERVPAERREVEDEARWRDAGLLSGWRERNDPLLHGAAEEFGHATSLAERLTLDEADEVPIVAEKLDGSADV